MSTQLANPTVSTAISMFSSSDLFELVQRQAKLIASSDLIPKQFQNNVPNCAIALEMASRLGASPFAVIQNLDVIHGRPSWRAVFLMGLVNNCGRFTPLQFKVEVTGAAKTADLTIEGWENQKKVSRPYKYNYIPTRCIAWAKDKATGEVVEGPPVSYDMAIEEGWVSKSGSKWQTEMRELMLRYRAASFFAKVYASDVMLGMQTSEEAHDMGPEMRNVTPTPNPLDEALAGEAATKQSPAAAPEVEKPATTRRTRRDTSAPAATEEKAPAAEAEEQQSAEEAEVIPPRLEMISQIKEVIAKAEISLQTAQARYQAAGFLDKGKALGSTTDEELLVVYKNRLCILPEEPEAEA